MTEICPTVLADNPHTYRQQVERVEGFADRIQIDLVDGIFASPPTISADRTHWPKHLKVDIHLMYENPLEAVEHLLGLRPNLIILHAESNHREVDESFSLIDKTPNVRRGLALLADTAPQDVPRWLKRADHLLIFAGHLGSYGGKADIKQTEKVKQSKEINPNLEIGWDGGVDDKNAAKLIRSGVDVLNVGGFIQKSSDPKGAYAILQQIASTHK